MDCGCLVRTADRVNWGAVRAMPNQRSDFPDPGLLLFGSVTNAGGGLPSPSTAVTWQISSDPT